MKSPHRIFRSGLLSALALLAAGLGAACGDSGTEADRLGVGAQCTKNEQCQEGQNCLAFKGGYCGLEGCTKDMDCPAASACVAHEDGKNYCFRICGEKIECNRNRTLEFESNCVSNVTRVDPAGAAAKFCVPPSGK